MVQFHCDIMEGSKHSPGILPRAKTVMIVSGFGDIGCCFNLVCLHIFKYERCPPAIHIFNYICAAYILCLQSFL